MTRCAYCGLPVDARTRRGGVEAPDGRAHPDCVMAEARAGRILFGVSEAATDKQAIRQMEINLRMRRARKSIGDRGVPTPPRWGEKISEDRACNAGGR